MRFARARQILGLARLFPVVARHRRIWGAGRREFLDHVLFWNTRDLERKLADFQTYYNAARSHASLEGHTPLTFAGGHTVARTELNNVRWVAHCRDLVQSPIAA